MTRVLAVMTDRTSMDYIKERLKILIKCSHLRRTKSSYHPQFHLGLLPHQAPSRMLSLRRSSTELKVTFLTLLSQTINFPRRSSNPIDLFKNWRLCLKPLVFSNHPYPACTLVEQPKFNTVDRQKGQLPHLSSTLLSKGVAAVLAE